MKCDRRWWTDGRLEREQAACVVDGRDESQLLWQSQLLCGYWVSAMDAHIAASLDALSLRLMAGDPTGEPWHEVLAAWTPSSAGTFFGVRRP